MRVGVDARELCGHATGVGRYLAGLLAMWATDEQARKHEFVLYAHQPLELTLDTRRFPTRHVRGGGGTFWEQTTLPRALRRDHLDVFFAPGYTAPLWLPCPLVVAIHDISFIAHPEWFTMREGLRRRVLTRRAAASARAIITISEFSRRELVERVGIPAARIALIPPGIAAPRSLTAATSSRPGRPSHEPAAGTNGLNDAARPEGDTVLYVGSIFNRRHLPDLLRGFGLLAARHRRAALTVVGTDRTFPPENFAAAVQHSPVRDRIDWRPYVTDAALAGLYADARAFAFLSEYEGLGMTPLEALAAGVPPVLLDTAVARESCGDAAVYVPGASPNAIAAALEQALYDEAIRNRILAAAPAVLARYSWPRAARETLAALEQACNRL